MFDSFLGSSLANVITLKAIADAFREQPLSIAYEVQRESNVINSKSLELTGIQKELFERARGAFLGNEYERSILLLIRATRLNPYYPFYFVYLGCSYHFLGQFDSALECYDKALDLLDKKYYVTSNEHMKMIQELSKECERSLKPTLPAKVKAPIKGSKSNANAKRKSTAKRTHTLPKGHQEILENQQEIRVKRRYLASR